MSWGRTQDSVAGLGGEHDTGEIIMPSTFKTLLTLTSALAITGIACAQDKIPESNTELKSYGSAAETSVRGTAASDMFSESDID